VGLVPALGGRRHRFAESNTGAFFGIVVHQRFFFAPGDKRILTPLRSGRRQHPSSQNRRSRPPH
jgi:hypothetical protein